MGGAIIATLGRGGLGIAVRSLIYFRECYCTSVAGRSIKTYQYPFTSHSDIKQ